MAALGPGPDRPMIYVGFALAVLGGLLAGVATTLAALNWAWQRGRYRLGPGRRRMTAATTQKIQVGERVRFDGKRTSWLARAESDDGRYTLLTASIFGQVYYSIIDWQRAMRGPMNVIGWGLGIETTSGPDEAIDEAMEMLRPYSEGIEGLCGFELSHRGEIRLNVTHRFGSVR